MQDSIPEYSITYIVEQCPRQSGGLPSPEWRFSLARVEDIPRQSGGPVRPDLLNLMNRLIQIYLRMDLYRGVFGVGLSKPIQSINPHSDVVLEEWGRCVGGTKAHESLPTWLCWWNGGSKKPPYMVVLEEWRAQGSLIRSELSLGS
ncbi:hypothetical protein GQ457_02G027550 [Hibiscus cannabinus]